MASHNHAPAIAEGGLQDDCPRCDEHAEHPFDSLDDSNLKNLVERTVAWMHDEAMPRSRNEWVAMRKVEAAIRHARAMVRVGVSPIGAR